VDDDELRRSLQRRADDVRPRTEVPPNLGRRAGRRIALNAIVGGITAVVVIVGAVLAIHTVSNGRADVPIGVPTSSGPSTAPSPAVTRPAPSATPSPVPTSPGPSTSGTPALAVCTDAQLRAVGVMEGAAGSREGTIDLTNLSGTTCTLEGRPNIGLSGSPSASDVEFLPTPAGWQADAQPAPPGWPVVTLAPGDAASVRIRWGNWCPQGSPAPLWHLGIPGSGGIPVTNGMEEAPPCNGAGAPSTVEVGPFEPQRPV